MEFSHQKKKQRAMPPLITTALPLILYFLVSSVDAASHRNLSRHSFPPDFIFGAASASYQYEGAAFVDGKGPSIWDTFTHKEPGKISNTSNGDVANDFYNRYKDDIKSLKYIGVDSFRLSISWPRILPHGKLSRGVNKKGIAFYNNVFNELTARGMIPFVTLFHWDLPQALEDEYEGFLSPQIIDDFRDFAELCFKEFGDRVHNWITVNEPFAFIAGGYSGALAPGRCSDRRNCSQGNSSTEPYIAAHNLLLSHAATVKLYKDKYQGDQKGEIGITLVTQWFVPYSNSSLDVAATQRALDFMYGWFLDPIVHGDYPKIMSEIVGDRLPIFTEEQKELLKGSYDFLGLNYYTANYAEHQLSRGGSVNYTSDTMVRYSTSRNGVPIGQPTGSSLFYVYPEGFYELLIYTKEKYKSPTIYITENGMPDNNNGTVEESTRDPQRINFYIQHLQALRKAIRKGVKVKGYFPWTFLDDFEWGSGYTLLFGFYYVDRQNRLKRIPKKSLFWYKKFLSKK